MNMADNDLAADPKNIITRKLIRKSAMKQKNFIKILEIIFYKENTASVKMTKIKLLLEFLYKT